MHIPRFFSRLFSFRRTQPVPAAQPAPADTSTVLAAARFALALCPDTVLRILPGRTVLPQMTSGDWVRYAREGILPDALELVAARHGRLIVSRLHTLTGDGVRSATCQGGPADDACFMDEAARCCRLWSRTSDGIPFRAMHDYVPLRDGDGGGWRVRTLVWRFKYGRPGITPMQHVCAMTAVAEEAARLLRDTFGTLAPDLTLLCIPASAETGQWLRWCEFSRLLCSMTGMQDSFPHVRISRSRTPSHLGGGHTTNYVLDAAWFDSRAVVVFDDVLTTGASLSAVRGRLEAAGASVVAAVFIGHTVRRG